MFRINSHLSPNGLSGQFDLLPNEFEIEVKVEPTDRYSDAKEKVRKLLRKRGIFLQDGVFYSFIVCSYQVDRLIAMCLFFKFSVAHRRRLS